MKRVIKLLPAVLILFVNASCGQQTNKNTAPLSENAPVDKPVSIASFAPMNASTREQLRKFDSLIAPPKQEAKNTLQQAKKRFEGGLKEGEAFFLTIRLFDKDSTRFEQVFVRIKKWDNDSIIGTIADQLNTVRDYHQKQTIAFKEKDIIDWLISEPDGSEQGNYVGKYLDTHTQ